MLLALTAEGGILSTLTSNDWGVILTVAGAAIAVILACIGSAIGVGKAGQAAAGVVAEHPERFGNCMVLELLPGSQGIYGFVIAILMLIFSGVLSGDTSALTLSDGFGYLMAALPIGVGGLLSAIHQGKVAVSGIHMLGKRADGFGNAMMLTLMVETYALLSFIISIMMII